MVEEYSPELCKYLGRIELEAYHSKDSYGRYRVFGNALDSLPHEGLSEEDSKLARDVLEVRVRETKTAGGISFGASGEAGEAD